MDIFHCFDKNIRVKELFQSFIIANAVKPQL